MKYSFWYFLKIPQTNLILLQQRSYVRKLQTKDYFSFEIVIFFHENIILIMEKICRTEKLMGKRECSLKDRSLHKGCLYKFTNLWKFKHPFYFFKLRLCEKKWILWQLRKFIFFYAYNSLNCIPCYQLSLFISIS